MSAENTPARSTSDPVPAGIEALRAAVQRIEDGESTGLFDDLPAATPAEPRTARAKPSKRTSAKPTPAAGRSGTAPSWGAPEDAWQGSAPPPEIAPAWAQGDDGSYGGGSDLGEDTDTAKDREPPDDRDADPYAVARQIALRQLTMSPKSRHQLRQKLRQRDCPDDVAEAVLDRLEQVGLVDDEKYAEALVRSKQVTRGLSKRALAHELRQKGVAKDTADAVLDQVSPTEEEDRATALVAQRLPRLRGLDRDTVMRRLAGLLARKGYPSGLSFQVIRQALDADPAFRRD